MFFKKKFLKKLGPGIITGASDDDPSGILTYLQTGVVLGISSLWTVLVTLPLMYFIQEMCARLGLVTDKGLIRLIKEHYSRTVLLIIATISVFAITVNIGADLLAIGVVAEKLTNFPRFFWIPVAAGLILSGMIFFSYRLFSRVLKWLTLSLLFYVATVLYININWSEALLATIWPIHFSFTPLSIMLLTAIVGTTISPYLFFWQASEEVEERDSSKIERGLKRFLVTKHELKNLKEDTFLGMLFSNGVMWFLLLAAVYLSQLYGLGIIENFDQAALALKPLLGDQAFLMFGLGIIGTGLLAIPVLAGSVGYILAEAFGWQEGISLKFREAPAFYIAIILATVLGLILSFFNINPVQLLIHTALLYAIITPFIIFIILRLANNKKLMGQRKNTLVSNIFGWTAFASISALVIAYLFTM